MSKDTTTKDTTEEIESPTEETVDSEDEALTACQEQVAQFENLYKRALADYQNLEKRVRDDRGEWIKAANRELLSRLLPVLDTLEMANKHIDNQGLKLSVQQFLDALKNEGVDRIETIGKEFDPHCMECFETVEGKEGKVVEEVRAGFKLYEKVLRPAQVKVGKSS